MESPIIAYCEKGAWSNGIKALCKTKAIAIIHFPYDQGDRRWHENHKIRFANPSLVTADTTELYASDDFCISDMSESEVIISAQIARVLKQSNRAFDVRHFVSAYKSGARVFISEDTNYSKNRSELYKLTGIEVINPSRSEDMERLQQIITPR